MTSQARSPQQTSMASGSPSPEPSGLELEGEREDRGWELRAQRLGWGVFLLLILAALAGLLGHGPFSRTQAGDPASPLRVVYNRFERYQGPTELQLHLKPEAVRDGKLRVWIGRDFLEGVEIERIEPEPETVEAGSDRHVFVFNAPRLTGETAVIIRYLPERKFARQRVRTGLEPGPELKFHQFVYP